MLSAGQPLRHGLEHGPQKGKVGPRRIQVVEPASQSGGVGDAIGIFERRRSIFPRAPLHKAFDTAIGRGLMRWGRPLLCSNAQCGTGTSA